MGINHSICATSHQEGKEASLITQAYTPAAHISPVMGMNSGMRTVQCVLVFLPCLLIAQLAQRPCSAGIHGSSSAGVPDVHVNASSAPTYPETMEAGHVRYAAALQDIADRHCSSNILVVTHGEAVRQSVARTVCGASCLPLHVPIFGKHTLMPRAAATEAN